MMDLRIVDGQAYTVRLLELEAGHVLTLPHGSVVLASSSEEFDGQSFLLLWYGEPIAQPQAGQQDVLTQAAQLPPAQFLGNEDDFYGDIEIVEDE